MFTCLKSVIWRCLNFPIQLAIQIPAPMIFSLTMCLSEFLPMIAVFLYATIILPWIVVFAAFQKCFHRDWLCSDCNPNCNGHSGGELLIALLAIILGIFFTIIGIIYSSALTVCVLLATFALFVPKRMAVVSKCFFRIFNFKWHEQYVNRYIETHSELDYSLMNLIILPICGVLATLASFPNIFIVLIGKNYNEINTFIKLTTLIFKKTNYFTLAYLDCKRFQPINAHNQQIREEIQNIGIPQPVFGNNNEAYNQIVVEVPPRRIDGESIHIPMPMSIPMPMPIQPF